LLRAQRRNGETGIVELMPANTAAPPDPSGRDVLIDQPSALDIDMPLLAGRIQRRAGPSPALRSPPSPWGLLGANRRHARLMMAAFSPAIAVSVSPRNSVWSMLTGAITLTSGVSITLVASAAARPTSSSTTSAGCCENRQNAAAVSIQNGDRRACIGPLAMLQRRANSSSPTSVPPPARPSRKHSLIRTRYGEV
jgi:hypothetical protein